MSERKCFKCNKIIGYEEAYQDYVGDGTWQVFCLDCHERKDCLYNIGEVDDFIKLIHDSKLLRDEEMLVLVKLMPFLNVHTSAIILTEALQRVLKK